MSFSESVSQVKKTTRHLSRLSIKNKILKYFFKPIDYTRTREIPAVISLSNILDKKKSKLKILDISSPQILSTTLAFYSDSWEVTYINPFEPELDEMERIKNLMGLKNIEIKKMDITNDNDLMKIAERFDYIFSVSVFEHIHPEIGGDAKASSNVKKILTENGFFIFSVPFYKDGFNEYKFGDSYSVQGSMDRKIFFQRFYDNSKLNEQIVIPSQMQFHSQLYIGERFFYPKNIHKRFAKIVQSRFSSVLFGKLFFILSAFFMTTSQDFKNLKKPYIATIMLRNTK
jgi:SAM-dependent methyltransferase